MKAISWNVKFSQNSCHFLITILQNPPFLEWLVEQLLILIKFKHNLKFKLKIKFIKNALSQLYYPHSKSLIFTNKNRVFFIVRDNFIGQFFVDYMWINKVWAIPQISPLNHCECRLITTLPCPLSQYYLYLGHPAKAELSTYSR